MNSASIITMTSSRSPQKANAGFTLIELMISITLGLLVVAAASQLLLGGLVSSRLQQGAADAQDSGVFGLDYIAKDIRLANYGNVQNLILNDTTLGGGIVLTADTATPNTTVTNLATVLSGTAFVSNGFLSHGAGDTAGATNEWQGLTKVTVTGATISQSDQLTIQFIAPAAMTDCEGGTVNVGDRVIQRYFLRPDTTDSTALVLACNAGRISAAAPPNLTNNTIDGNYGGAGQVMMQRVEHMHVLLGTQTAAGVWRYFSIRDYMALTTTPKPQIKSIQISVLVRSLDNTNSNVIDPARSFTMLDQTVTPTANQSANRYVRRVYTTTIALRNGLGSSS